MRDDYYGKSRHRPNKKVLVATSAAMILLVLIAAQQTITALSVPPKKTLVVGTNTPFQPFEYVNGAGQVVGFDMDLAKAVADKLGMNLRIQDFQDFYALLPALDSGNVDLAVSAITITQTRSAIFSFSIPYYNSSQGVLVEKGSKLTCHSSTCSPSDFSGFTIAYQSQTTSESWVLENLINKVPIKGNVSVADFNLAVQLLKTGRVDAVVVDYPVAKSLSSQDSSLSLAGNIPTNEQYGMVVKGGDPQHLLPTINSVIQQLLKSGDYQKLQDQWFGK